MELLKITKQVTDSLEQSGVGCRIVGSVASSATDCTSERQWTDILGILRATPDIDLEYMKHWATQIGVLDLLEQALGAA